MDSTQIRIFSRILFRIFLSKNFCFVSKVTLFSTEPQVFGEKEAHEGVTPLEEFEDRLALLEPKLWEESEDESFDLMFESKDFSDFSLFLGQISFVSLLVGFSVFVELLKEGFEWLSLI